MQGIGLTIISAFLFGAITVGAKSLLGGAGPATVGALTYLGAGLVGLVVLGGKPLKKKQAIFNKSKSGVAFMVAAILGAIIAPLLLMIGLQKTTASFASILANIEGIATAALAWFLFREKTNKAGVVSVIAILAGVVCFSVAVGLEIEGSLGPFLIGAAYLCWALDINLMRYAQDIDATWATAVRGLGGAAVMAGVAWMRQEPLPDNMVIISGLLVGAVGFGVSYILLLRALPLIGTAKTGAINASAPVFAYLCSCLFEGSLGEISSLRVLAMMLIALGIVMVGADTFMRHRVEA